MKIKERTWGSIDYIILMAEDTDSLEAVLLAEFGGKKDEVR